MHMVLDMHVGLSFASGAVPSDGHLPPLVRSLLDTQFFPDFLGAVYNVVGATSPLVAFIHHRCYHGVLVAVNCDLLAAHPLEPVRRQGDDQGVVVVVASVALRRTPTVFTLGKAIEGQCCTCGLGEHISRGVEVYN
ncbi:putative ripening-related protein 6 [Iris pallida]|uniref:Ripening-related protein 6 n=1 Tax=Iris pallida TaxID=29817 RepID=A0AAX6FCX9_IRIPA|nr:putative ripening-related protein 6 [Iris pallida]